MTTEACSHCQTPVSAETAACPKCGAKRKVIEVETGAGKLRFSYFHAITVIAGGIAGYFIGEAIYKSPGGLGTSIDRVMFGAVAAGVIGSFVIPRKPETKPKTIWIRENF